MRCQREHLAKGVIPITHAVASAGLAKVLSATGSSEILGTPDPVFEVSFRFLFAVAGTVELIVSALCLFVSNIALRILSVAWLSSVLQGYRLVAAWIGYKSVCPCLG